MTHIHEKIDFTASTYVVHADKVLLRKHEKYGIWLGVGGHIELDEDPNEAAVRERKEEVGLDVALWKGNQKCISKEPNPYGFHRELAPPVALNRHDLPEGHEHVDLVYFASAQTNEVVPEHPDDEWRWLSLADLQAEKIEGIDLMPHVRFYATHALRTLGT